VISRRSKLVMCVEDDAQGGTDEDRSHRSALRTRGGSSSMCMGPSEKDSRRLSFSPVLLQRAAISLTCNSNEQFFCHVLPSSHVFDDSGYQFSPQARHRIRALGLLLRNRCRSAPWAPPLSCVGTPNRAVRSIIKSAAALPRQSHFVFPLR
jgi:hypothetical protein